MSRVVTLALIQAAAFEDAHSNLERLRGQVADAAGRGAKLACLPDLTLLPFFPQNDNDAAFMELAEPVPDGKSFATLSALAVEFDISLVASIYECVRDGVYYDAAVAISNQGALMGVQRMMHIPQEPGFSEKFYYKAGNSKYPVFELAGARVGIAVGQDHFYPEHHRLLAIHGAEIILSPNAIAEETDPLVLSSQAAAVMNHVYVGVANRVGGEGNHTFVGRSHVALPSGDVAVSADSGPEVIVHDVDLSELARVRRTQNYWLRDRRPETYGDLVEDLV